MAWRKFIKDLFYSRRTLSGLMFRGEKIECDFASEEEGASECYAQVDVTDIDQNDKVVNLTITHSGDIIAVIYLTKKDARELGLALYDPLKG